MILSFMLKPIFVKNELGTGPSSSSHSIRSAVNYRDGSILKSIFFSESFFMSWVFRNIEALVKIPPFVSAKIFDLSLKQVFKWITHCCILIGQWSLSCDWLRSVWKLAWSMCQHKKLKFSKCNRIQFRDRLLFGGSTYASWIDPSNQPTQNPSWSDFCDFVTIIVRTASSKFNFEIGILDSFHWWSSSRKPTEWKYFCKLKTSSNRCLIQINIYGLIKIWF